MSLLQIVCQNCGAKYRLPETFSGDRAKCKSCGSVIDVAAQRDGNAGATQKVQAQPAKARPAAAKPAAAKPAGARAAGGASKKTTAKKAGAKKATARAGSRRAAAEDEDEAPRGRAGARRSSGGGSRRSSREAEPAKNNNMMIYGGLGAVVLIVVLIVALGGDNDPNPNDNGDGQNQVADNSESNGSGSQSNSNDSSAGNNDSTGGETNAGDQTPTEDPSAGSNDGNAEETSEDPSTGGNDAQPSEDPTPTEETVENPYDPRTELEAIAWPESIAADDREEAEGWVEDLEFGGFAGINAKKRLTDNYWVGTFAVLNKLRTLDLSDADQVRYGDDLTRHFTEQMIAGIVVPWRNVNPSETPSNADRDRNGKNVKALFDWANRALTGDNPYLAAKDSFEAWVETRRKQRDG
ncbi:MAG: hypothetical protein AAF196_20090 [Planctomycetota bacterium]